MEGSYNAGCSLIKSQDEEEIICPLSVKMFCSKPTQHESEKGKQFKYELYLTFLSF